MQRGAVLFTLLSPERFMMPDFRESLITMTERNHVYFSYGVIDEVHCVSEWGHDFRTSYLHLGRNMIQFMKNNSARPLSIIGLTATASFDVLSDVERELTLNNTLTIDSESIVRPENDTRSELTYRIVSVKANFDPIRDKKRPYLLQYRTNEWSIKDVVAEAKMKALCTLLPTVPTDIAQKNKENPSCLVDDFAPQSFFAEDEEGKYPHAGIIFCPHAKGKFGVDVSEFTVRRYMGGEILYEKSSNGGIARLLVSQNPHLEVSTFVGGDDPLGDMRLFNHNDKNLMVATKAFGMGIDKPNIRYTINFNHPSSIESFVQEAGRGGRDRKNAISYLLYEPTRYIHLSADKIHDIRQYMGKEDDPEWLTNFTNRYVLFDDLFQFCLEQGASKEQTQKLINIITQNDYL